MLKIASVLIGALGIWLTYHVLYPINNSTWALNEEITLQSHTKKPFQTDFQYNYGIELTMLSNTKLNNTDRFEVQLNMADGRRLETFQCTIFNSAPILQLGNFDAQRGEDFELVFGSLSPKLEGQKANLKVDVTGLGPSVGLSLARAMRPYLWLLVGILGITAFTTGYFGFRKTTN